MEKPPSLATFPPTNTHHTSKVQSKGSYRGHHQERGKTSVHTEIQPQEQQCHFWVSLLDRSCSKMHPASYISLDFCQNKYPNTPLGSILGPAVKASLAGIPPKQATFLINYDT
nr:hypothetical protein [Tanacetum cinerariifolium]